jgi:hypothetical protein
MVDVEQDYHVEVTTRMELTPRRGSIEHDRNAVGQRGQLSHDIVQ